MTVEEQKIERILRNLLNQGKANMPQSHCPDEETLATYLAGGLLEDAKDRLEAHLSECALCVDTLLAAYKTMDDKEHERVPQAIIDKAMALVSPAAKESFFDLIVRLVQNSVELVSTSGWSIIPVPAAAASVRSASETPVNTILKVEKPIGRFNVVVEVEKLEAMLCQITVRLKAEDEKPVEGIRVSLLSGGRELASYAVRQGRVVFDRLPQGEYNLAIAEAGAPVGTIRLKLMA